jgi:hypothetical protein
VKSRPSFDPWPDRDFAFHGHHRQTTNWMPWIVIGILGVGVGISALVWLTA